MKMNLTPAWSGCFLLEVIQVKQPKNISYKGGGVSAQTKWPNNFADMHNKKMDKARETLKEEYLREVISYMPHSNETAQGGGGLIKITQNINHAGPIDEIIYPGVITSGYSSRFLDEGYLMVDEETGSAYAKKGNKKIVKEPKQKLKYHGAPKRGAHWNERMIEEKGERILDRVSKAYKEG